MGLFVRGNEGFDLEAQDWFGASLLEIRMSLAGWPFEGLGDHLLHFLPAFRRKFDHFSRGENLVGADAIAKRAARLGTGLYPWKH